MNINGTGSALGLYITRQYNAAAARNTKALEQLSSGSRVNRASDDPSAIGRIESLKSRISEMDLLGSLAPSSKGILTTVSETLNDLLGSIRGTATTPEGARALAALLREKAGASYGANELLAGDPTKPETTTIHHDATSGTLQGGSLGTVTVAQESQRLEGFTLVGKATVRLTLDGNHGVDLLINSGSHTASSAVSALRSAVSSQTSLVLGVDLNIEVANGGIAITSLKTGASSSVSSSGAAAGTLKLNSGTRSGGRDAYDEVIVGADSPLKLNHAGRDVELVNLIKYAEQLEDAAGSGASAIQSVLDGAESAVERSKSVADFTIGRLAADVNDRTARGILLRQELDQLTSVDIPARVTDVARSRLQMEQAQWAMRLMRESQKDSLRTLLDLRD